MIKSCGGGKYKVVSHSGKNLSKCMSMKKAKARLSQVEYFKHRKGAKS
jgi:hypothetical protein